MGRGFDARADAERRVTDTGAAFPARDGGRRRQISSVRIEVFDNQIEPALKALKKQMLADGVFKEMKLRAHYEKPSVKRKRKQAEARRKRRKALKRAARFEGPDG
jgi:small subunit ribosomal protein S21